MKQMIYSAGEAVAKKMHMCNMIPEVNTRWHHELNGMLAILDKMGMTYEIHYKTSTKFKAIEIMGYVFNVTGLGE